MRGRHCQARVFRTDGLTVRAGFLGDALADRRPFVLDRRASLLALRLFNKPPASFIVPARIGAPATFWRERPLELTPRRGVQRGIEQGQTIMPDARSGKPTLVIRRRWGCPICRQTVKIQPYGCCLDRNDLERCPLKAHAQLGECIAFRQPHKALQLIDAR